MEKCEPIMLPVPHNFRGGEVSANKIRKLINTAKELGGTVYEVACESGLLSAYHFLEEISDEEIMEEKILPENLTVVTEVYVHYPGIEDDEQVFLYSDNAERDYGLKDAGSVREGRLIIECGQLKSLYEKGYSCIFQRVEGESVVDTSNRYFGYFGRKQRMLPFRLWDDTFTFLGNGFNQALVVCTVFETVFVMPDVYAVQESIKVFHAENLIREKYDASFRIERISELENVTEELESVQFALFGRKGRAVYDGLGNGYKKMLYQITYIKVFYPEIYDAVWNGEFEPDDERTKINFDECNEATLAISLSGYEGSFAVCKMADGSIKRVPGIEYSTPLLLKYQFKGYGNILNAGVAASRMALIMKNILQATEFTFDVNVTKVYVTHIGDLPDRSEIAEWMEKRKENAEMVDLIAYQEIADRNPDGLELIRWAAEQAKLPDAEYVDSVTAIVNAYEKAAEEYRLKDNEVGLIYDFSEKNLAITLFRKHEGEKPEIIIRKEEWVPEVNIYDASEPDEKAFKELKSSVPRVKRQFRRNDTAILGFNNGFLNRKEDYPIESFAECFQPILVKNEKILRSVMEEAGICMEDIAAVYLAGTESEYPFVKKNIEEITGKKACCINASECVAARGAVLG